MLCAAAYAGGYPAQSIQRLLALIRTFPNDEILQRMVAHVFDAIGDQKNAVDAWQGIAARFPQSNAAFIGFVSAVVRKSGPKRAAVVIASHFSEQVTGIEALLTAAKAWAVIGDETQVLKTLQRLATLYPERIDVCQAVSTCLESQGRYRDALDVLNLLSTRAPRDWHRNRLAAIEDNIVRVLPWASYDRLTSRRKYSLTILNRLLQDIVAARNATLPSIHGFPKSAVMIIGSLGAGGAERQLVATSRGIFNTDKPVFADLRVIVQSCRSRRDADFFSDELRSAGIPLFEYEQLPLYGGRLASSIASVVAHQLRFLPVSMVESILRLSDALRAWRPDVVQIWQEETVFDTALSALLARVPKIILCLRSVPPIDRPERYRLEYPILFHSLLAAKNVIFSCNSDFAAGRYSEWLGIGRERIRVIRNGVERRRSEGDAACAALYNDFDARTRGEGCFTIGVIMRMDENKRPFLWVKTAARMLQHAPEARFILVGNGPLRNTVVQWLKERGILHRFLFVGVSSDVGFWLSKLDLFMLLSKEEGLPNSVIEAQLSKVPVVITPAGGAPEAIIPGVTGVVTKPNPTADEVAAVAMALVKQPQRAQMMGNAGEAWAQKSFSVARMLHEQAALLTGVDH